MASLLDSPTPLTEERMPLRQLLFSLQGRVPRRIYWQVGVLGMVALATALSALLAIAGLSVERAERVGALTILWPQFAISAKRWHDRGRSTAWALLNLVPGIGQLWSLIDNGFVPSDAGPNAYGPPRERGLLD